MLLFDNTLLLRFIVFLIIFQGSQATLIPPVEEDVFDWNEYQQGQILGAFFWLHWLTQVPGGILAQYFGTKLVFGISNFAGVLCGFFIPVASKMGSNYLCALRVFQGFVTVRYIFNIL